MLSSFFHPGRAYRSAQDELQKYYGQAQGYLQPYAQQGKQAYGGLSEAMGRLLDPAGLQAEWIGGYETSPAAQQAQEMARQSGLGAASAMGLMGSTPALQALQAGQSRIGLQDRQQYLNDLMQKYMAGTGIGQNIYGTGAGAAGQMAQGALGTGKQMGGLAYGAQAAPGNLLGNLLGVGLGAFGFPTFPKRGEPAPVTQATPSWTATGGR